MAAISIPAETKAAMPQQRYDLSNDHVHAFAQDSLGFVWVATANGLNKSYGKNYDVYFHDKGDPRSIPSNNIMGLYVSSDSTLWVATARGVCARHPALSGFSRYLVAGSDSDTGTDVYIHGFIEYESRMLAFGYNGLYTIDQASQTLASTIRTERQAITASAVDDDQYLWLTNGSELLRIDRSMRIVSKLAITSGEQVTCMLPYGDGRLILGTNLGLRYLDVKANKVLPGPLEFNGATVSAMLRLSSDAVMVCTGNRGAMVWHCDNATVDRCYRNMSFDNIPSTDITAALETRDGNVWVGTFDSGLFMVSDRKQIFNNDRNLASLMRNRFVTRVTADHDGRLWIGTRYNGIQSYNPKDGTSVQYKSANTPWLRDFNSDFVQEIYCDSRQRLWIGYGDALLVCDILPSGQLTLRKSWPHTGNVVTMAEDSSGRIWAGTSEGGIQIIGTDLERQNRINSTVSNSNNITRIIPFGSDKMLFSAYSDNIYVIDTGTMVSEALDSRCQNEWNAVIDFIQDSGGRLWFGTYDNGLICYDTASRTMKKYTGFLSNDIVAVEEDTDGNIWVSSSFGLYRINSNTDGIRTYLRRDGIGGNQFHEKCRYIDADGHIYFGGNAGLEEITPANVDTARTEIPVYLTDITMLRGQESLTADSVAPDISYLSAIDLSHDNNAVTLGFTGLCYDSPEHMEYAYRLKGLDNIWIHSGTHNRAVYSNLPPGHYTFMVAVKNSDGHWSEPTSLLDITVHQAPWLHPLAIAAYIIAAIALILFVNRLYLRARMAKKRYALAQMQVEQERRNTENKVTFYNNISHELRTPLTMVYAPVKLLRSKYSDLSQKQISDNLEFIDKNIDRLLRLTNQLLSFRDIKDKSLPLKVGRHDVVAQLDSLVRIYNIYAAEKDISVRLVCPYSTLTVTYDSDKLDKIVNNLIFNATKYTPAHGHITVEASLIAAPDGAGTTSATWLEIRVIDDGIGIESGGLSGLFERFKRLVSPERRDKIKGFGIGLNFVRHLVSVHKGTIHADQNSVKGMTFTVALPVADDAYTPEEHADDDLDALRQTLGVSDADNTEIPEAPERHEASSDTEQAETDRPRLLVVEDRPEMNAFIRDLFADRFDIISATDGAEGLHQATECVPDVIITDVMMPGMDGYALTAAVKADPSTCHVPVIMLTAKTRDEDRISGYSAGADMYLAKPFNPNVLISMVGGLMARKERMRSEIVADAGRTPAAKTDDDLAPLDRQFLDKLYAYIEDNLDNCEFNVNLLGREMGFSRTNLYRKIKALTGVTPIDLLRVCRLNRAAELLLTRKYSILEISEMTGFGTQSHFSNLFKRHFGVPPREYTGQPPVGKQ